MSIYDTFKAQIAIYFIFNGISIVIIDSKIYYQLSKRVFLVALCQFGVFFWEFKQYHYNQVIPEHPIIFPDRLGNAIGKGNADTGGNAARLRSRIDKKRSYTTSILVSPHPDRKLVLPQRQHSAGDSNSFSISSGDVTVAVGKVRLLLFL